MPDVYTQDSDPDRILINTNIGNVQAWRASPAAVAVAVSLFASVQHAPGAASYVSHTLNLTAADARDLARALTEAADHADKVQIVVAAPVEEAA